MVKVRPASNVGMISSWEEFGELIGRLVALRLATKAMALGELVSAAALIGFPLFTLFHDTGMRTEQKCSHSKYKASATPQALFGRANKHCLFGRGKNVAFRDNSTHALNHEIGRIYRQAYCGKTSATRANPHAAYRFQLS